jgi:hypothetical protein
MLQYQKSERREQQPLRLLLHDEMDQHGNADEQQAAEQERVNEGHRNCLK